MARYIYHFILIGILAFTSQCTIASEQTSADPTLTIGAVSTTCPAVTPITVTQSGASNDVYFIIIESTNSFHENESYNLTIDLLNELLIEILQNNDRLIITLINARGWSRELSDVIVFDGVFRSPYLNSTYVLQIPLVPTPIPAYSTFTPRASTSLRQTQEYREFQEAQLRITETYAVYNCRMVDYNSNVSDLYSRMELEISRQRATFIENATRNLRELASSQRLANNRNIPIFEVLTSLSIGFNYTCRDLEYECFILLFSDLLDRRGEYDQPIPSGLPTPNLEFYDLYVIMYGCPYNNGACATKINNWSRHFEAYAASSFNFILNSPITSILDQLKQALSD